MDLLSTAVHVRPVVRIPGNAPVPRPGEAFVGFRTETTGLIVAAESMSVFDHHGSLSGTEVVYRARKWWAYYKRYWQCSGTKRALPYDEACEVLIPAGDR
jgi:hypothetical protein